MTIKAIFHNVKDDEELVEALEEAVYQLKTKQINEELTGDSWWEREQE